MHQNRAKEPLLKESEVAELLALRVATLRRWRWAGAGPRFIKIGAAVRYRRQDIEIYIEGCERNSTSDTGSEIVECNE